MSGRVPPSSSPNPERLQGSRVELEDRPVPLPPKLAKGESAKGESSGETLSPEAQLWGGADIDRSLEIPLKEVEARLAEASTSEAAEREEAKEYLSEAHEEGERKDKLNKASRWAQPGQKSGQDQKRANAQAALMRRQKTSGQESLPSLATKQSTGPNGSSYTSLAQVGAVNNRLAGEGLRPDKPPDAFKLLKEAKEKGVLFTEDALADGHAEERDDPALAEAVEECIRTCFGLRGILRIGPGKNEQRQAIIVVSISQGFTDRSFTKIPPAVHGFPTLVAIPFELLPLKRER